MELGCATAHYKELLGAGYVGLDITLEPYGEQARKVDVVGSARFLPFADNSFDMIFSVAAAYHFPGQALALKEARRCLKNGGRYLCFTYTRRTLESLIESYYEQQVPHLEITSGADLRRMAGAAGFRNARCLVPEYGTTGAKRVLVRVLSGLGPLWRPLHDLLPGWWLLQAQK